MESHNLSQIPDEMVDEIQYEIPEVSYDAVIHNLRRSIITFCEKSHYWKEEIDPIVIQSDATSYELTTPRTVAIVSVMTVRAGDRILDRNESDGVEYRYWQPSPFSIEVNPVDKLVDQIVMIEAAVKPVAYNNTFKFSSSLLANYQDALIAGAKALLYKTPRKDWTDIQQAQINDNIFEPAAQKALLMQSRGYSRVPDRSVARSRRKFF